MDCFSVPLLASYLQRLKTPMVQPDVIKAVTNKDMKAFEPSCIKAQIPRKMITRLTRIVFSVEPDQGWPPPLWF